ncbi:conserved hypothetical protein [Verticillium alfalfae VaMs.102]|uniref:Uncharacterized protein n=1 Tax=Verticillium alfalfae (strain VaMs.102 / ATCC MYA-4576 / FGSC 10136) TaxID=526221 RepID=C9SA29_VERA1|nr:conserved hypothetical protein [Verticillium alfalfae VaMs.102]EEY16242.1 conserved hypothetical protein [Verticillium alfalfae VaMs.102]
MLDNFTGDGVRVASRSLKGEVGWQEALFARGLGWVDHCECRPVYVDIISTSSIHQGVGYVDFSLKIDH